LTSAKGQSLNKTVEEYQRLELEAQFQQDAYKSALVALEKGRVEATRTLKKVLVLQSPSMPEYPLRPAASITSPPLFWVPAVGRAGAIAGIHRARPPRLIVLNFSSFIMQRFIAHTCISSAVAVLLTGLAPAQAQISQASSRQDASAASSIDPFQINQALGLVPSGGLPAMLRQAVLALLSQCSPVLPQAPRPLITRPISIAMSLARTCLPATLRVQGQPSSTPIIWWR
jgi:hypothetical protein